MDPGLFMLSIFGAVVSYVILYYIIKFAVKNAIKEAHRDMDKDDSGEDAPPYDRGGRIATMTCPQCGRAHDMDYPKCPYCGHVHITL